MANETVRLEDLFQVLLNSHLSVLKLLVLDGARKTTPRLVQDHIT